MRAVAARGAALSRRRVLTHARARATVCQRRRHATECNKHYHPECKGDIKNDCGLTAAMLLKAMNTPGMKDTAGRAPSVVGRTVTLSNGGDSSSESTSSLGLPRRNVSLTGTLRKFVVGDSSVQGTVRCANHVFLIYSYKAPVWCKVCGDMLWGLAKQGYRCTGTPPIVRVCAPSSPSSSCSATASRARYAAACPGCASDVHIKCVDKAIYPCHVRQSACGVPPNPPPPPYPPPIRALGGHRDGADAPGGGRRCVPLATLERYQPGARFGSSRKRRRTYPRPSRCGAVRAAASTPSSTARTSTSTVSRYGAGGWLRPGRLC